MKKFLAAGMLAICLIAASQEQASAWTNHQFSFGMNWSRSTGGNSHCWGAHKNGQPPGPEAFQQGHAYPQQYGFAMPTYEPAYAPPPVAYYPSPYQFATYPQSQQYYYPAPDYYYGR